MIATPKDRYKNLQSVIHNRVKNNLPSGTGDFQCPNSGWGCEIYYDDETGMVWAEIMDDSGNWVNFEEQDVDMKIDTYEFVLDIGIRYVNNVKEANKVICEVLGNEAENYVFSEDGY